MKRNLPRENTGRVVAVAVAFFGSLVLLGWERGVFARLAVEEVYALVAFGAAFALASYALDEGLNAWVKRVLRSVALRKSPGKSPAGTRAAT